MDKLVLTGVKEEALAQATTEGLPLGKIDEDPVICSDSNAGHGGFYPPVNGWSDYQNYSEPSKVVVMQQERMGKSRNIGEFPRGKQELQKLNLLR